MISYYKIVTNTMLFDFEYSNDYCLQFINQYFEFWSSAIDSNISLTRRIIMFKKHVLTLSFISASHLVSILRFLNNVIRVVYLSKKYSNRWLSYYINKKDSINTSDLELNSIDPKDINQYINYIDYEQKQHYLFSVTDFTNLIHTNLENCNPYDIEPQPLSIKNPYTNKVFTKNELIEINKKYCSRANIPLIWHMFINNYYDIDNFKTTHYDYLLNICIPSFIDKLEESDIRFYLLDIFQFLENNNYCKDCISEKKSFRSKSIRKILIYWLETLKLGKNIDKSKLDELFKIYSLDCSIHNLIEKCISPVHKKRCDESKLVIKYIDESVDSNEIFYMNFMNPFVFSMGSYTKEDKRKDRRLYKDKRREKMRLKKGGTVKNI